MTSATTGTTDREEQRNSRDGSRTKTVVTNVGPVEVRVPRDVAGSFDPQQVCRLTMDCETVVTPDQGQQLLVLTPADADTRERLELLRVLGIEEFSTEASAR
ncbi:transposase [Nonomuraea sp. NPDC050451]|uniref:transposase n=1 Tax=Nonomuraea sp. NPDC050451 TaxID=3364364 RepID=UPI0037A4EE95